MTLPILSVAIKSEEDVPVVRQRAHQIARLLQFDEVEQTRIATAVSEIARNAFEYGKGGKAEFYIDEAALPASFAIRISDQGPGIKQLNDVLDGRYKSTTGMGVGVTGSRRLMDSFKVASDGTGTIVTMGKSIPKPQAVISQKSMASIAEQLAKQVPTGPVEELHRQNQEILTALRELERKQSELSRLNQELAETNRGVVALYAELDSRAEEAQRADAVKTRFLSHMTHEFRTPVNSVLNLTKFLIDRTDGDLTPEQEKQIKLIQKSMESLSDMVNDLLDLAKVEAGKVTLRVEEFPATELFASLRGMFRPLARNPNVELVFEDPATEIVIRSDEGKISQILRNFISNALKFTEAGTVHVKAVLENNSKFVSFSIADTGIGIAPEDQLKIFEEFSQIENRIQKKVKGTGLGLPLSKKLGELLGGAVSVQSTLNKGSVFALSIPLRLTDDNTAAEESFAGVAPFDAEGGTAALIIDDNEATCYALKRALTALTWNVSEARDGQQGLRFAAKHRPNIIFLDIMMPDMTGFEVLEHLKRSPEMRDIPVIIHTSQILSEAEKASLNPFVAAILSKNMNAEDVSAFVKALVSPSKLSEAS